MTKQNKSSTVRVTILEETEDEDSFVDKDIFTSRLTELRRDVRLSDESDYFDND